MSFAKLDSGIVNSTLWVQPDDVLRVWIWLLSQSDQHGMVRVAAPALALVCMKPVDRIREILAILESPDPDSRSCTDDGRRIRKVEGGWEIINYGSYRNRVSAEEKREADRVRIAEKRAAERAQPNEVAVCRALSQPVASVAEVAQAEAEADTEKRQEQAASPLARPAADPVDKAKATRLAPDWTLPPDWAAWAKAERPDLDIRKLGEQFGDHWRAKPGKDGRKLDWLATWRNWVRSERQGRGTTQQAAAPRRYDDPEATRAAMAKAKALNPMAPEAAAQAAKDAMALIQGRAR